MNRHVTTIVLSLALLWSVIVSVLVVRGKVAEFEQAKAEYVATIEQLKSERDFAVEQHRLISEDASRLTSLVKQFMALNQE